MKDRVGRRKFEDLTTLGLVGLEQADLFEERGGRPVVGDDGTNWFSHSE